VTARAAGAPRRAPAATVGGGVAGRDTNIGAKRARETRAALGLGPGEPVRCVLTRVERDLEIPVVIAALPEGIAGCCWRDGGRIVLWVNGTQAGARQRFTLGHELGHVRCGHDERMAVDTSATLAGRTTDSREIQANAFAAELLAPADGVRAMVDDEPTLEDVVRIAARYGISAIAALYRLNTLGLTRRRATLEREIEDDLHEAVRERLELEPVADAIAAVDADALPRLSPALAGSALAALVARRASVPAAARAAGCEPHELADGAAAIGV
jgi:Zn-dependent peptidase ImmA (M78 family)